MSLLSKLQQLSKPFNSFGGRDSRPISEKEFFEKQKDKETRKKMDGERKLNDRYIALCDFRLRTETGEMVTILAAEKIRISDHDLAKELLQLGRIAEAK